MTAIEEYIKYWDDWHCDWHSKTKINPFQKNKILNYWDIPSEKINKYFNSNPIWRYFPEPYWCNPYSANVAVFLNLNPGGGGDCQDVLSINQPSSIIYNTYSSNKLYSRTVEQLSKNLCYITTNWFDKKRVNWLNKLMNCNSNSDVKYSLDSILCADLIPWHTPTVNSTIKKYIENQRQLIFDHVIDPITYISQQATLRGLVFAKGKATKEILTKQLNIKQTKQYKNGKYEINLFDYNNSMILVFVGGQGMSLPNPCNKNYTLDSNKNRVSISDIVQQIQSYKI